MGSVVEGFLTWAHANSEGSINQPSLPHAIIVLNLSSNETGKDEWDEVNATEKLLTSATAEIEANPTFRKYMNLWRNRNVRIDNLRDLLLRYYTDVTVLRLPNKSRYDLIDEQRQSLYSLITRGCDRSHRIKARAQMLADSDDIQTYFQCAFDHFSRSLDPFDFVAASVKNNPIPCEFRDHILTLARIVSSSENVEKTQEVFSRITKIVGSCILLDAVRCNLLGNRSHPPFSMHRLTETTRYT